MSFDLNDFDNVDWVVVSIPLEQGNVFRPTDQGEYSSLFWSQSLWNRAMSFDFFIS